MATNTMVVQGSKGNTYIISVNPTSLMAQCSCPAFRFSSRVSCKHIEQALRDLTPTRHLTLV